MVELDKKYKIIGTVFTSNFDADDVETNTFSPSSSGTFSDKILYHDFVSTLGNADKYNFRRVLLNSSDSFGKLLGENKGMPLRIVLTEIYGSNLSLRLYDLSQDTSLQIPSYDANSVPLFGTVSLIKTQTIPYSGLAQLFVQNVCNRKGACGFPSIARFSGHIERII